MRSRLDADTLLPFLEPLPSTSLAQPFPERSRGGGRHVVVVGGRWTFRSRNGSFIARNPCKCYCGSAYRSFFGPPTRPTRKRYFALRNRGSWY